MNFRLFVTCLAATGLAAGAASAAVHHDAHHATHHRYRSYRHYRGLEASWARTYALPAHPIPYADLSAYLKDSPGQRTDILASGRT